MNKIPIASLVFLFFIDNNKYTILDSKYRMPYFVLFKDIWVGVKSQH